MLWPPYTQILKLAGFGFGPSNSPAVIDKIVHFYDKSVKLCQITTNPKTNISGYGAEPNSTLETSTAQRRP